MREVPEQFRRPAVPARDAHHAVGALHQPVRDEHPVQVVPEGGLVGRGVSYRSVSCRCGSGVAVKTTRVPVLRAASARASEPSSA
ncbi:hypothetical protein O1L60_43020 [Streptomyces diastatochromogenes]|nr:hypothetical protein [Streptomyces diastatochromogenes]